MRLVYLLLLPLLFASCAKPYYITDKFDDKTSEHQLIAVLPPQVITKTGGFMELTQGQLTEIAEAESKAFHQSFHQELLKSAQNSKPFRVDIQAINKTNRLLEEAGISIQDSWEADPEVLSKALGVDAVVRNKIEKTRYMSDLASMGISLGKKVIGLLTKGNALPYLLGTGDLDKTEDIKTSSTILDGSNSTILWNMAADVEADWNTPGDDLIDKINRRTAAKFPYR